MDQFWQAQTECKHTQKNHKWKTINTTKQAQVNFGIKFENILIYCSFIFSRSGMKFFWHKYTFDIAERCKKGDKRLQAEIDRGRGRTHRSCAKQRQHLEID